MPRRLFRMLNTLQKMKQKGGKFEKGGDSFCFVFILHYLCINVAAPGNWEQVFTPLMAKTLR